MISPAQLALMQKATGRLRTTSCVIQRKASVSDGMGGQTDTWSDLATVLGRITPVVETNREVIDEQRLEVLNRWLGYFDSSVDITEKDRVVALGSTYEVTSANTPRTIQIEKIVEMMQVVS